MAVSATTALLASAAASGAAAYGDYRSNKRAVESAERQKADSQNFIQQQIQQARGDIFRLFPSAQDSRTQGALTTMDLWKQAIPAQINSFRQGNMNAQHVLSSGLPQIENALMGRPVDYSQIQPRMVDGLAGLQMPQTPQLQNLANALGGK